MKTPPRKRRRMRPDGPRLTPDDWLDAAHAAVVAGGFDSLRVLQLARALHVSRGSFYWHFGSRAELQSRLLERWRGQQSDTASALQSSSSDDPRRDLEQVLSTALAQAGDELEHMRFELALRGLGRRDAAVARLLAEVDDLRLGLFERKFLQLTGDARSASELAALFYLAVVGCHQALARPANPPQLKAHLQRLVSTYLIEQQAPRKGRRHAQSPVRAGASP